MKNQLSAAAFYTAAVQLTEYCTILGRDLQLLHRVEVHKYKLYRHLCQLPTGCATRWSCWALEAVTAKFRHQLAGALFNGHGLTLSV